MREKVQEQIKQRIVKGGRGKLYVNSDFADIALPDAVRKALQRLTEDGFLVRSFRGIYCYPKIETELRLGVILPSLWDIAYTIARRDQVQIAPTAAEALNQLGLSTQVPMNAVFYTTGSQRHVKVGNGKGILFIHSSDNKLFAYHSKLMQLIVLSMREIGEGNIKDKELEKIKGFLEQVNQKDFTHDICMAPGWIQEIIHRL